MDSGNSDSFQSSNGGDEEYNSSRGGGDGTISAFINQAAATARGGLGLVYNTNHTMFDNPIVSSNYQNLQNNIFPKTNLDNNIMVWSEPIPNCTETINNNNQQPFTIHQNSNNLPSSSVEEIMNTTSSRNSSLPSSDHHQTHGLPSVPNNNNNNNIQTPKKRSRASRRAPTTVLTTDTNNFRAMVQEFTGIPAPPFTSSSSLFPRNNNSKLDNLFGTTSSSSSMRLLSNNNHSLDYSISPPPYLRRPFAQKAQPLLVPPSSSNVDDIFTMQNPILTSLLHSNNHPKPTLMTHNNNTSIFGTKAHHGSMQMQSSSNGFLQGPVDNNNNAILGELPGLVSADPTRWGGSGDGGGANGGEGEQGSRSFGNNNNNNNNDNGKRLKGMMEEGGRSSEGMMETWICSSSE